MGVILEPLTVRRFLAALALVIAANVVPWIAGRLLGERWALPLDCGAKLPDGARLLGSHKTWRGLVAAAIVCTALGGVLGYPWTLGGEFALLALLADAVSSFVKRRLRLAPGTEVALLDQLPEALLPLLLLKSALGVSTGGALAIAVIFLCLDVMTTPLRQ
ncbi:MAG TPA: CDP-archaeol synthase [Steroidobacteraceae bacterium]|nr:CDP-archaeol synthase [Steroidobacteraceae bacterium]